METKQQAEQRVDGEKSLSQRIHTVIGDQVINVLGQPAGFHRVQVRKLWDNRYRVNVFSGPDITSAIVAHSYFLVTDAEGTILTASPVIRKQP